MAEIRFDLVLNRYDLFVWEYTKPITIHNKAYFIRTFIIAITVLLSFNLFAQKTENVSMVELNLDTIFTIKQATFVLMDVRKNLVSVYNPSRAKENFPAHSTVKIPFTIAALEQNIVHKNESVL